MQQPLEWFYDYQKLKFQQFIHFPIIQMPFEIEIPSILSSIGSQGRFKQQVSLYKFGNSYFSGACPIQLSFQKAILLPSSTSKPIALI